MNLEFSIDELDLLLKHEHINVITVDINPREFNRDRWFRIGKYTYRIRWWPNICYLFTLDGAIILFSKMILSTTWPHNTELDIQFLDNNGHPVCILPITPTSTTMDSSDYITNPINVG